MEKLTTALATFDSGTAAIGAAIIALLLIAALAVVEARNIEQAEARGEDYPLTWFDPLFDWLERR